MGPLKSPPQGSDRPGVLFEYDLVGRAGLENVAERIVVFWVHSCANEDTSMGFQACTPCGNFFLSKMHGEWTAFVEQKEEDEELGQEVDEDIAQNPPSQSRRPFPSEDVTKSTESGYEVYTNLRIVGATAVSKWPKKKLAALSAAKIADPLDPKNPEAVYLFQDDDPDLAGFRQLKLFNRVTLSRNVHLLRAEDHTFKSQGSLKFNFNFAELWDLNSPKGYSCPSKPRCRLRCPPPPCPTSNNSGGQGVGGGGQPQDKGFGSDCV
jgi:hypothetical protein